MKNRQKKRKKNKYVIIYINKENEQKRNYVYAYTEYEAVEKFLLHAEKATIVAVEEMW